MDQNFVFIVAIIVINCFVFVLPYLYDFGFRGLPSELSFQTMFFKDNRRIQEGEYFRLLTSTFLHANFIHLLLNMYSLWIIGLDLIFMLNKLLTPKFGIVVNEFNVASPALLGTVFLTTYLLTGVIASYGSYRYNKEPSLGASGCIMGIFGLMFALGLASFNIPIIINTLINLALIVILSMYIKNVDNVAHWFGFGSGVLLGFLIVILAR
jgi:rhomboid protease GluP